MIVCIDTEDLKGKIVSSDTPFTEGYNKAINEIIQTAVPLKKVLPSIVKSIKKAPKK